MQLTEETVGPLTQDPVCGRHITEAQALLRAEHEVSTASVVRRGRGQAVEE